VLDTIELKLNPHFSLSYFFRLTGTIPHSFGKVTNLVMLKLGSNEFSGPLRGFSAMEYLLHVDLSGA
jgi:hypothetical protein